MSILPIQPLVRYPPEIVKRGRQALYRSPEGELLPSISNILAATKPVGERIVIARWRKKVGQEEANRISKESALRGRELHKRIEQYLTGQLSDPCPEAIVPWRDSIKPFLEQLGQVLLVEGAVFHSVMGYAGTLDAIAYYEDEICLIDWKTANSPRKAEYLVNYKLQVAALWGAIEATYGLRLRRAVVAIALPGVEAQLYWLDEVELGQWWLKWLKRLEEWRSINSCKA